MSTDKRRTQNLPFAYHNRRPKPSACADHRWNVFVLRAAFTLGSALGPEAARQVFCGKKFVAAGCGRARQAFRGMAGGGIGISG